MRAKDWVVIGVVGVALLLLWKLLSKPTTTVNNAAAANPWVGALDAAPGVLNVVGGWFGFNGSGTTSTPPGKDPLDTFEGE